MSILVDKEGLKNYTSDFINHVHTSLTKQDYDNLATKVPYTAYCLSDKHVIMLNGHQYGVSPENDFIKLTGGNYDIGGNKVFNKAITLTGLRNANSDSNLLFPNASGTLALKSDIPTDYITEYIKSAAIDGNKLTLTNADDTEVTLEPTFGETMTYKGLIASGSLPTSGNVRGDYYNLSDNNGYCAIWNGTSWDQGKSTPTIATAVQSGNNNAIQNKAAYNYINSLPADSTKLNHNGSNSVTGTIPVNSTVGVRRNVTNSYISLFGGDIEEHGAHLILNGKDRDGGSFELVAATNSKNYSSLKGYANGTLTWRGGERVVGTDVTSSVVFGGGRSKWWNAPTCLKCMKLTNNLYYICCHATHIDKYQAVNWAEHLCDHLQIEGKNVVAETTFPNYCGSKKDVLCRVVGEGKVLVSCAGDCPKGLFIHFAGICRTA